MSHIKNGQRLLYRSVIFVLLVAKLSLSLTSVLFGEFLGFDAERVQLKSAYLEQKKYLLKTGLFINYL